CAHCPPAVHRGEDAQQLMSVSHALPMQLPASPPESSGLASSVRSSPASVGTTRSPIVRPHATAIAAGPTAKAAIAAARTVLGRGSPRMSHDTIPAMSGAPPFPEVIGRYEILVAIASGGMATVYLAR